MENSIYFSPSVDGASVPAGTQDHPGNAAVTVEISTFRSQNDNHPRQEKLSLQDFVARMLKHPVRPNKNGPAFSPAIYPVGAKRGNQNVTAVSMLVLDIDDGTPIDSLSCKLTGIRHLVYSTHSHKPERHKYRVIVFLAQPIPAAEWPDFWQRADAHFGGHMDQAAKDSARLYFMPAHAEGTEHFSFYVDGRPLTPNDLPALPKAASHSAATKRNMARPTPKQLEDMGIEVASEPHPAEALPVMMERCPFMQYASAPENQPNLSEPEWRCMVANAAMAEGSDTAIHAASEHHPGYSEAETDRKIKACRDFGAPLTCVNIRAAGFNGCPAGGCMGSNGVPVKAPAALMHWYGRRGAKQPTAAERILLDSFSVGDFTVSKKGIEHTGWKADKNGNERPTVTAVSRTRIEVKCLIRDAASGNWSVVLLVTDPDGIQKEYTLPLADLHAPGKAYRQDIARLGGLLCPGMRATELFADYVMEASMDAARETLVTRLGWQPDGAFAVPGQVYGGGQDEQHHFRLNNQQMAKAFEVMGSMQGWTEVMGLLSGNSRLQLFVCTALAGCVLELLGIENYGFNIVGPSSIGKSTALRAAESVWRQCHTLLTWNGTSNGIQALAVWYHNTMMALDEMGMSDAQALFTLMYFLANGTERARAQQNGEHRETKSFSITYLSTSERSPGQILEHGGKTLAAGQGIRMMEIPALNDLGIFEQLNGCRTPAELADRINAGVKANSGHAGRAWVSLLADAERQPLLLQRIRDHQAQFVRNNRRDNDAGQTLRALDKFALTAAVGLVCCEEGIVPWDLQDLQQGIQRCFEAWVRQRGCRGELEAVQAIEAANRFIMLHGASRFERRSVSGIEDGRPTIINRAGFVEDTDDGQVYYVNSEVYKKDLCGQLDPKMVTRHLQEAGLLVSARNGTQHRLWVNSTDRHSFYAIKGSVIGEYRPAPQPVVATTIDHGYLV